MTLVKTNITKIEIPKLDFKNRKILCKIYTDTNSPLEKTFTMTNSEEMTKQIISEVKESIRVSTVPDEDSIFSSSTGVYLMNSDDSIKKITHFISGLIEKTNKLRMSTDAHDYMKLFNEVNDIHVLKL